MTEDEMVRWYHQLHGHEFEQALGDGEGQGSLQFGDGTTSAPTVEAQSINHRTAREAQL